MDHASIRNTYQIFLNLDFNSLNTTSSAWYRMISMKMEPTFPYPFPKPLGKTNPPFIIPYLATLPSILPENNPSI